MKNTLHRLRDRFGKLFPSFCILIGFLLVLILSLAGLALNRRQPEVTLTDLSGDAALLDQFPLTFTLMDNTSSISRHCPAQFYTLKQHRLRVRTGWLDTVGYNMPDFSQNTPQTIAHFTQGPYLLTVTLDLQDWYQSPLPDSTNLPLDVGCLLTISRAADHQIVYQGRLHTAAGDDNTPHFPTQTAADFVDDTAKTASFVPFPLRRVLTDFVLKGAST